MNTAQISTRQKKPVPTRAVSASTLLQIFLGCIVFATGCTSNNYTSTITSIFYDERKNTTQYLKIPYGSVSIPGKWKEKRYNPANGQQFLVNNDAVVIAVAMVRWDKFQFYKPEMDETAFVDKFYEWDSEYLAEEVRGNRAVLKRDASRNYLVWRVWNDSATDTYFLFGMKNNAVKTVYTVSVYPENAEKWNENRKIEFLESVFLGTP